MAHTIQMTATEKAGIAFQVAQKLGQDGGQRIAPAAPGAAPLQAITETFPVWVADDQISPAPGAAPRLLLSATAHDTGMFHHNIVSASIPAPGAPPGPAQVVAAARSRQSAPGAAPKVEAITYPTEGNELFRWIRNAAYWVQHNAPGDPFVRLLIIPSRYVHCFWLSYPDRDRVVVIDMPESFTHLKYRAIYDADEFYRLLQQEPVIRGLGSPDAPGGAPPP